MVTVTHQDEPREKQALERDLSLVAFGCGGKKGEMDRINA